jgi:hypothetical protein
MRPALMVRFEKALGTLGMTPADRSRVAAIAKEEAWDEIDEALHP